ncbi:uncharacterized protein LOC128241507 [Mya arenaria]|uniref:uncharacterized protein LOC128241507 n=1 Tax=Mya arenaria TaxID=6604 RepID=UPI0022E9234F|nr:uncharacterized protein LOC128241507 [Mya arenaria]
MCDKLTTTCTSTSSKLTCTCKEGYVNNTRNNEMFQCSWADATRPHPTPTTTTEQPVVTTKYIEPDPKTSQTALIATGAGLGGLVLILLVIIVVECRRQRTHKEKEAEQIQLKEREKKRQTGFEGSFLERNYTGRHPGSEHKNGGPYPSGPFKPISNGRTSPFKPVDTATGRVFQVPEPKAASPPPEYHRRNRSRERPNMSRDSGLNGFNSSGSMESTRSRDSHVYESLEKGRAPQAEHAVYMALYNVKLTANNQNA